MTGIISREILFVPILMLAVFSTSSNDALNSYSIGSGATNNSSSSTYTTQATAGQTVGSATSSTTYTTNNGQINTEQLNLPGAPTLSNGGGAYSNELHFIIIPNNTPTDITYSVAVSTDNFVTTNYVQADGTLGASRFYQSYLAWGGASGQFMISLLANTTYKVKVDAKQGLFTNTNYGPSSSASTINSLTSLSIASSSLNLGNLSTGTVVSSTNDAIGFTTSATSGGTVYISGASSGLKSNESNHTIPAYTGNLGSASEGFGVQGNTATQSSGGPLVIVSPFNGTANIVGAESGDLQQLFTAATPIVSGSANITCKSIIYNLTPAGPDYQEILTIVGAGNF